MITSVTIEGFKSFGAPSKPVELGPLNFIVGANASGKTNFVSALKFLKLSLLHGLDHTVNNEFNGCRETRNHVLREREGEQKPCCISVRLKKIDQKMTTPDGRVYTLNSALYKLKADLRSDNANPSVFSESFEAKLTAKDGSHPAYTLERDAEKVRIHDPTNRTLPDRLEAVPPQESAHLTVASGYFGLPALLFRELVTGWTFFNVNSEMARLSSRETPGVELGSHGENLAAVLHEIEKSRDLNVMKRILGSLRGAVPRVKEIKPLRTEVEGKWTFQIVEDRIRALSPSSISDGTIRLLTLLVATCWSARNSSLIIIEEPENNLHPHLYEQLVAMFRVASTERQVIVTTHNPGFLDLLEPHELLLCEREAETTFTKLEPASGKENIEIFRRQFSLGELWVQGVLGGIPV